MTSPIFVGRAINPASTDLDLLRQDATQALAQAQEALQVATDAAGAGRTIPSSVPSAGRTDAVLADYLDSSAMLWLGSYGVKGDGSDDTAALQAALDAGAAADRIVYGGSLAVRITGPVSCAGPGIVFDAVPDGVLGDPGIFADFTVGPSVPAVTFTGAVRALALTVYGSGQVCNGVRFLNLQRPVVQALRVANFAGYGLSVEGVQGGALGALSVDGCGTSALYAARFQDGTAPCRATVVGRLSVSNATARALYIAPSCESMTFAGVDSPGLVPNSSVTAWHLGGVGCTYGAVQVASLAPAADAILRLQGTWSAFSAVQGTVSVQLEATSGAGILLLGPRLQGTTQEVTGQSGSLVFVGGTWGTWSGPTTNRVQLSTPTLPLTGGTLTGPVLLGGTTAYQGALRAPDVFRGVGVAGGSTGSIAVGGTADLADGATTALAVITTDQGETALFSLQGAGAATVYLSTGAGTGAWGNTVGGSSKTNVYWDAGASKYRLQNNLSLARTYFVTLIGAVPTR